MAKDAARRRAPVSPVQGEIKQRRPFTSLQQEALVGLLRTADLVRRRLEHHPPALPRLLLPTERSPRLCAPR